MNIRSFALLAAAGMAIAATSPANADVVTLDFEGIPDYTAVGEYYASQGFHFSPATLALIDSDNGGNGNFANEPSPNTIMFFLDANNAILNSDNGFDTGFSFYYTSSTAATINVWSGANATGTLLASLNISAQHTDNCSGDPNGDFCNFTAIGVTFDGVARSIDFGGTANQTGYDNITFGSATPGNGGVPEPATWAMLIAGFGLVGGAMRARRTTTAFA
jgi:hypothetical protein